MNITPLRIEHIQEVRQLMERGEPYISARTLSDYWLYATLFSTTCPVAVTTDRSIAGTVIAFRSQDDPNEIYIQDVMIHPDHRRQGTAKRLLHSVRHQAEQWGCRRLYLTSEPENLAAQKTWATLGFENEPGDYKIAGISVKADYKGPGRDRAVYALTLP
ncbi:GNAT family N-acetyltransferase [Nocardia sp. NPDC060259]|uniref:GNAT family N-acetyltransferase n=1 Tax=Nocardia sp. NPDC060259 TaxID=3347088 RepID=UPI00364EFA52